MILLTGSTGFIGSHYKEMYPDNLLTPTHKELDLTDIHKVKEYLHTNKPEKIIHCASNDNDVCLYDNLRMFNNLAESKIPMITFCTGREVEDRSYKNGEYVLSKKIIKDLALTKYYHIAVVQLWGCFGANEKDIRFFKSNMNRLNNGEPILIDSNRMFSYVYVKDVCRIIRELPPDRSLLRLVAYTKFFTEYANDLLSIDLSGRNYIVRSEEFSKSYVGMTNFYSPYTPLKDALLDMWEEMNEKTHHH